MHSRRIIHCLRLTSLTLLVAFCSNCGAAQGNKTEVLPADGGELGKAFVELTDAFKTADKVRAAKYLDPTAWHLDDKQPSWFAQLSEQLANCSSE